MGWDRGRGLDLCTGSVYWICVLDLCTVYRTAVPVPVQLYSVVPMDPLRVPPQRTGDVLPLWVRPYGAVKVPPQRTYSRTA